jgi:hypothetical protein
MSSLVGKMVIPIDSCEFFFSVAPATDSDLKIMIGRKATTYDQLTTELSCSNGWDISQAKT